MESNIFHILTSTGIYRIFFIIDEDKMTNKKLYRSIDNAMIGGVMAGIADYFNIDVTLVRVLYVFITIFSAVFPATLVYLICWAIIPSKKIFN